MTSEKIHQICVRSLATLLNPLDKDLAIDEGATLGSIVEKLSRWSARDGVTEVVKALGLRAESEFKDFHRAVRGAAGQSRDSTVGTVDERAARLAYLRLIFRVERISQTLGGQAGITLEVEGSAEEIAKRQLRAVELMVRDLISESYVTDQAVLARLLLVFRADDVKRWERQGRPHGVLFGTTFKEVTEFFVRPEEFERYRQYFSDAQLLTLLAEERVTVQSFLDDLRLIRNSTAHYKDLSPVELALVDAYWDALAEPVQRAWDRGKTQVNPQEHLEATGATVEAYFSQVRKELEEIKGTSKGIAGRTKFIAVVVSAILVCVGIVGWWGFHTYQRAIQLQAAAAQLQATEEATQNKALAARQAALQSEKASRETLVATKASQQSLETISQTTTSTGQTVDGIAKGIGDIVKPKAFGIVRVQTVPSGAEVRMGGMGVKSAPATFENIPIGKYPVVINAEGYDPMTIQVEVKENDLSDLGTVALEQSIGTLVMEADPVGQKFVFERLDAQSHRVVETAPSKMSPFRLDLHTGRWYVGSVPEQSPQGSWVKYVDIERGKSTTLQPVLFGKVAVKAFPNDSEFSVFWLKRSATSPRLGLVKGRSSSRQERVPFLWLQHENDLKWISLWVETSSPGYWPRLDRIPYDAKVTPPLRTIETKVPPPMGSVEVKLQKQKHPPDPKGIWTNGLEMKFREVDGIYWSLFETTVGQYKAFSQAAKYGGGPESEFLNLSLDFAPAQERIENTALPTSSLPEAKQWAAIVEPPGSAKRTLTIASWRNPGFSQTDASPVVGITAADALEFCRWLTKKERKEGLIASYQEYRLPILEEMNLLSAQKEKESRFEAREGLTPAAANGQGVVAAGGKGDHFRYTAPVGSFPANQYGLFDIEGNVREWVLVEFPPSDSYPKEPRKFEGPQYTDGLKGTFLVADQGGGWADDLSGYGWRSFDRIQLLGKLRVVAVDGLHQRTATEKATAERSVERGFRCVLVSCGDK